MIHLIEIHRTVAIVYNIGHYYILILRHHIIGYGIIVPFFYHYAAA